MKPIHKFNNGDGATLCHHCSKIISTGFTKALYCEECAIKENWNIKEYNEQINKDEKADICR